MSKKVMDDALEEEIAEFAGVRSPRKRAIEEDEDDVVFKKQKSEEEDEEDEDAEKLLLIFHDKGREDDDEAALEETIYAVPRGAITDKTLRKWQYRASMNNDDDFEEQATFLETWRTAGYQVTHFGKVDYNFVAVWRFDVSPMV